MSGYTKGPWEYIDASESARHKFAPACIIRGSGREVARLSWRESSPYFPSEEESKSNALLIAAAPELLKALQDSLPIWEEHKLDVSEASILLDCRAAIAKALGQ